MAELDQQVDAPAELPPASPRRPRIPSDSYVLLLGVGVIVLAVSLVALAGLWFTQYGLGAQPVIGKITAASPARIQLDIGSNKGLRSQDRLLALRRGTFLAYLSVSSVSETTANAVIIDSVGEQIAPDDEAKTTILTRGDTVILSPLDRDAKGSR